MDLAVYAKSSSPDDVILYCAAMRVSGKNPRISEGHLPDSKLGHQHGVSGLSDVGQGHSGVSKLGQDQ